MGEEHNREQRPGSLTNEDAFRVYAVHQARLTECHSSKTRAEQAVMHIEGKDHQKALELAPTGPF